MLSGRLTLNTAIAVFGLILSAVMGPVAWAKICEGEFTRTPPFEILNEDPLYIVRVSSPVKVSGREIEGDFRFISHHGKVFDLDGILPEGIILEMPSMIDLIEILERGPALKSKLMGKSMVWVTDYGSYQANPEDWHTFDSMSGRQFVKQMYLRDREWRSFPFLPAGPRSILVLEGARGKRIDKRFRQMSERFSYRLVPYPHTRANPGELNEVLDLLEKKALETLTPLLDSGPGGDAVMASSRDSSYVVSELIRTIQEEAKSLRRDLDRYDPSYVFDLVLANNERDFALCRKIKDFVRTKVQEARVALRVNGLKAMSIRGSEAVARGIFPEELLREQEGLWNRELDVIGEDGIFEVKSRVHSNFRAHVNRTRKIVEEEKKQDTDQEQVAKVVNLHVPKVHSIHRFKVNTDGLFLNEGEKAPENTYGLVDPDGRILIP